MTVVDTNNAEENNEYDDEDNIDADNESSSVITTDPTANLYLIEKDPTVSSVSQVDYVAIIEKCQHPIDFVVIGHTGRKSVLGSEMRSVLNLALRDIKTTVILANKPPCLSNAKDVMPKRVIMAVDGSIVSKRGLSVLFTLVQPHDTLELIYVHKENDTGSESDQVFDKYNHNKLHVIQSYYERELALFGPTKHSFTVLNPTSFDLASPDDTQAPKRQLPVGSMSLSFKSILSCKSEEELEQANIRTSARLDSTRSSLNTFRATPRYTPISESSDLTYSISECVSDTRFSSLRNSRKEIATSQSRKASIIDPEGVSFRGIQMLSLGKSLSSKGFGNINKSRIYLTNEPSTDRLTDTSRTNVSQTMDTPRSINLNSTAKIIVDYINVKQADSPPDFFAIAPQPRVFGDSVIGFTADGIISQLDCNIIICKLPSV